MTKLESTVADYSGLHLTTGPHLMSYLRPELERRGAVPVSALEDMKDDDIVRVAGAVIVRQRPGTAKGFTFLTMEDETGMVQAIIRPDLFREHRPFLVSTPVILVEGALQKSDGTLSVKARAFEGVEADMQLESHDFY
jgi:error-prone DNA polymerase